MVSIRNSRNHFTSATNGCKVSRKAFLVNWNALQRMCTVRLLATLHLMLHLLMHIPMLLHVTIAPNDYGLMRIYCKCVLSLEGLQHQRTCTD